MLADSLLFNLVIWFDCVGWADLGADAATHAKLSIDINLVMAFKHLIGPDECRTAKIHAGLTPSAGYRLHNKCRTLNLDWI